jgi:hypothetical protein
MKHLRVASRCPQDWDAMPGTDEKRFCDVCKKDVHYLSAMREADARALLASRDAAREPICVRVARDREGRVLFRSAAASALTTLVLATACNATSGLHDARTAHAASPSDAVDQEMGKLIADDVDRCPHEDGGADACPEGE